MHFLKAFGAFARRTVSFQPPKATQNCIARFTAIRTPCAPRVTQSSFQYTKKIKHATNTLYVPAPHPRQEERDKQCRAKKPSSCLDSAFSSGIRSRLLAILKMLPERKTGPPAFWAAHCNSEHRMRHRRRMMLMLWGHEDGTETSRNDTDTRNCSL